MAVEAVVTIDSHSATSSDDIASLAGELTLIEQTSPRQAGFELVLERAGLLHLFGPTAFLSVAITGDVRVSSPGGTMVLGPDCHIRCRRLELAAAQVEIQRRVHGLDDFSSSEPSVVLEATSFGADGALAPPSSPGALELRVPSSVTLRFPWYEHRSELEDADETTADQRAVRFLNMLMNLLRRHGHSGRHAVYDKKLEGRQSIKEADFANAVHALERLGIVRQEGRADLPPA